MKQKYKSILGFLGLVAVVAVTVFAASLPAPETQATSSVTDEITVKVVDEDAAVRIDKIGTRDEASKYLSIDIDYEKISTLYIDMTYNNGETSQEIRLAEIPSNYEAAASLSLSFDLAGKFYTYNGETFNLPTDFGYGEYVIHAYGYGDTEVKVITEDFFEFKYTEEGIKVPDTGTITEQKTNLMQTDYLVTGLVIFSLVGISGFMFISGREKASKRRHK